MTRAVLAFACALALSACTNQRKIGSTCEDGMCLTVETNPRIPCMVATGMAQITGSPTSIQDMCVIDRLYKDAGDMVPCRMFFLSGAMTSCPQLGFTDSDDPSAPQGTCEIPQLDRFSRQNVPQGSTATGWYVLGPGLPVSDTCAQVAEQRVRFNGPFTLPGSTWLSCAEAFATPETVSPALRTGEDVLHVAPDSCASLPPLPEIQPQDVGSVCTTRFRPPEGFFTNRTYVDLRSEQCETGVCFVWSMPRARSLHGRARWAATIAPVSPCWTITRTARVAAMDTAIRRARSADAQAATAASTCSASMRRRPSPVVTARATAISEARLNARSAAAVPALTRHA
jgi:hypothetical protein